MNKVILFSSLIAVIASQAMAAEIVDRKAPTALAPFSRKLLPVASLTPPLGDGPQVAPMASAALDQKLAELLRRNDCPSILQSLSPGDFEKVSPESLAVVASCEPPGKDPDKMFLYAERQAPKSDAILLLHARYRWRKQRADADELFVQLRNRTQDPKIKALAGEYVLEDASAVQKKAGPFSFYVTGQIGGLQQGNPQGLPMSDGQFGKNNSTAATAFVGASFRRQLSGYTLGADYLVNSATYWRTHDADLLAQDAALIVEKNVSDGVSLGLRPYGSFYLLNGASYYSQTGVGLTGVFSREGFDQWLQLSWVKDRYAPNEIQAESGTHYRFDWQASLSRYPTLLPKLLFFVDRSSTGADTTSGNFIPYSNTTYGLGISFDHLVHRYSVGLSMRAQWRKDDESTRVQDASGQYVSKRREDIRFVIRPSLTVPLSKALDLYFYFESDSVASSLTQTDGYDRNISDSTLAAVLRFSFANY